VRSVQYSTVERAVGGEAEASSWRAKRRRMIDNRAIACCCSPQHGPKRELYRLGYRSPGPNGTSYRRIGVL
jgi:hypothetical protein